MSKNKLEWPESHSVKVEKIKNGWLAHHTHTSKDGKFERETVHHPTKPKLINPMIEKPKGKK